MKRGICGEILRFITILIIGLGAFQARSSIIYVSVSWWGGLQPDPVYANVGDVVYWYDGDGDGPYLISGPWGSFYTDYGLQFNQAGIFSYSDDLYDYGTVYVSAVNSPPSVTITNPVNNAVLTAPATFILGATASDVDLNLSDVKLYVGTNMMRDAFAGPFTTTVTNLAAGSYTLTAIAADSLGATATNSISITVAPLRLMTPAVVTNQFRFSATGLTIGKTNVLQFSTLASPASWAPIATNVAVTNSFAFTNSAGAARGFYRVLQLP